MVCKPDEEEEFPSVALCVVRDFSGIASELKIELRVPPTMTCGQFVRKVAKKFNVESSSIRLVSPSKQDTVYQFVLTETMDETLKSVGVNFGLSNRNLFIVEGTQAGGLPRRITNKEDDLELGASASPEETTPHSWHSETATEKMNGNNDQNCGSAGDETNTEDMAPECVEMNENSRIYRNSYKRRHKSDVWAAQVAHKEAMNSYHSIGSGYRGLINQAMTCYLNSLLQALFMTPEFRNALYNWKYVPSPSGDEYKSIPYQLQKLFLNLQTSQRTAVETTDLTRSFGWDSSEAWQQHDIQELCRVMFDALEQEFKGTEQADLINRLYQGKMIDYVKCLECGTEKSREDTFLDIPLPVRPFGSNVAYGSVEEALTAFIQPETLEENNQYFCERCNKKCNAHKGLKFTKFPYLLTLHLMRFDFDYNTMHRIKLSDKVEFPKTLNLNGYIAETNITSHMYTKEEGSEGFPEEIAGSSSKCDDSSTTDSGSAIDDENCLTSSNDLNNVDYEQEVDEGIDVGNQHENEKNRNISLETAGPYVYELFSIMVHSGSASGGHYYVYIKDFATGMWYCFNDQNVSKITNDDIDRSYGGSGPSRGYYSGVYSSSMNAYMLMYRKMDSELNVLPLKEDEFPPHIKALVKEMDEKAEYDRKQRERLIETCKIKIYCHHPSLQKMIDTKVECTPTSTLKDVTQIAYKKLQLESVVPLNHCRLVLFNSQNDSVENSLDGRELDEIGSVLNVTYLFRKHEMLLEIRKSDVEFPVYKVAAVSINLYRVWPDEKQIDGPLAARTSLGSNLSVFKDELYEQFRISRTTPLLLCLDMDNGIPKFLSDDDDEQSLRNMGVKVHSKIFVCCKGDFNDAKCRQKIRMLVKRCAKTIKLIIMLPDIKPEIFERLSIPTLCEQYTKNGKLEDASRSEKDTNLTNGNLNGIPSKNNNNGLPAVLNTTMTNGNDVAVLSTETSQINSHMIPISGHHSDQSASEDSSLTDSERTIVGDAQDDCQLSSSGSSPRNTDDRCHDLAAGEGVSCVGRDNNVEFDDVIQIFDANKSEDEYDYFNEISNTVSLDKKTNGMITDLRIEVDQRMSMESFKKHLEKYVQAPSAYFKLYSSDTLQGDANWSSKRFVMSLKNVENDSVLHVKLVRNADTDASKIIVYFIKISSPVTILFHGDFNVNEDGTVGETKKELLQDFKIMYNLDIPFDRCRIRRRSPEGYPGVVYSNDQKWKDIHLGWTVEEVFLQCLNENESSADDESQKYIIIIVRSYPSEIREIVIDDLSVDTLKKKVAEVSGIPEENLALGEQSWLAFSMLNNWTEYMYSSDTEIDWTSLMNQSRLEYKGQVIHYKDDKELSQNGKVSKSYARKKDREKSLKIHVNAT